MTSVCPTRMSRGLAIPFASAIASTVVLNRRATRNKLSSGWTTYVVGPEGAGAVVAVGAAVGAAVAGSDVAVGRGVAVAGGSVGASVGSSCSGV
jgi:hypothetical protein